MSWNMRREMLNVKSEAIITEVKQDSPLRDRKRRTARAPAKFFVAEFFFAEILCRWNFVTKIFGH